MYTRSQVSKPKNRRGNRASGAIGTSPALATRAPEHLAELRRQLDITQAKFAELAEAIDRDPARRARVEQHKAAMLAELRRELDITQVQLAERLEVTQRNVSHVEHEPNPRLATLSAYITALGGHLELRAVFEDRTVPITLPDAPP